MLLPFLILIAMLQVFLYHFSDYKKFKYGRALVLTGTLAWHLFFFPQIFIPEPQPDGMNCGMPAMGIILVFWVIGGGSALLIHLIYFFVKRKSKNENPIVPFNDLPLDMEETKQY